MVNHVLRVIRCIKYTPFIINVYLALEGSIFYINRMFLNERHHDCSLELANGSISPLAVCIIIHGVHIRRSLSFSVHRYESGRRVSAVCIFAFSLFIESRFLFPLSFSLRVGASSKVHLVKRIAALPNDVSIGNLNI